MPNQRRALFRPTEMNGLRLERTAAAAGFHGVGVLERKALLFETFVPVDGRSVQVQSTFLIDHDGDAVRFKLAVRFLIETVIEIQRVVQTAAATTGDTDPQQHRIFKIVLLLEPSDFLSRPLG